MNKENLQLLIDHLRNNESRFNMRYVFQTKKPIPLDILLSDPKDCGTSCCMLGWTNAIINNFEPMVEDEFRDHVRAAQFFDIDVITFYLFCFPFPCVRKDKDPSDTIPNIWQTAFKLDLLKPNPSKTNLMLEQDRFAYYPMNASAKDAITVLEAIRDGIIPLEPYTYQLS